VSMHGLVITLGATPKRLSKIANINKLIRIRKVKLDSTFINK